jgi:hypothetical protein
MGARSPLNGQGRIDFELVFVRTVVGVLVLDPDANGKTPPPRVKSGVNGRGNSGPSSSARPAMGVAAISADAMASPSSNAATSLGSAAAEKP